MLISKWARQRRPSPKWPLQTAPLHHTQDHRRCHCFHGVDPQPAASRARLFRSTWLHVCMPRWPCWDGFARLCRAKLLQLDNKQANWSLLLASGDGERERLRKHILEVGWAGKRLLLVVAHGEFDVGCYGDLSLSLRKHITLNEHVSEAYIVVFSHLGSLVHVHTFTHSLREHDLGLCSQEAHVLKPALSWCGWVTLKCKASWGGSSSSWCVVPVKYAPLEWITPYHTL